MSKIKGLVVPIFRRYWLWHPVIPPQPEIQTSKVVKDWKQGESLEAKFQLLSQQFTFKIQQRLVKEWQKLENAGEGTFKNRLYRLAQSVLAREDPTETFLKSIPPPSGELDLIYPSSYKEKLVRRRLRHLAASSKRRHRSRLMLWCLSIVPQIPLMVSPLPNLLIYYCGYRIYSHYKALQGSKSLEKGFAVLDSQQLRALRDDLLRYQALHDVEFPADSWPAKLIKKEHRYLDIFERLKILQKQRKLQQELELEMTTEEAATAAATATAQKLEELDIHGSPSPSSSSSSAKRKNNEPQVGLALLLTPSEALDAMVQPQERKIHPLSDSMAVTVAETFEVPQLLEAVAKARKRATGSMFPTQKTVGEWPQHD